MEGSWLSERIMAISKEILSTCISSVEIESNWDAKGDSVECL